MAVSFLVIVQYPGSDDASVTTGVDSPPWDAVEESIRQLDGHHYPYIWLFRTEVCDEPDFAILGGNGEVDEELPVYARIEKDFGSFDAWIAEFKAVAAQARGWAITCWDPSDSRIHVYLTDGHDAGGVWGAQPIIPLDVWEHAYYYDHGPNRAAYVEAFLANLNWKAVDQLYRRAAGL